MDKSTVRTETIRRKGGYRMRSAKVFYRFLTVVLGLGVPGIALAQTPAPASAPQASPQPPGRPPENSLRADEMAAVPDYG